jgi:hypothetical protein
MCDIPIARRKHADFLLMELLQLLKIHCLNQHVTLQSYAKHQDMDRIKETWKAPKRTIHPLRLRIHTPPEPMQLTKVVLLVNEENIVAMLKVVPMIGSKTAAIQLRQLQNNWDDREGWIVMRLRQGLL